MPGVTDDVNPDGGESRAEKAQASCCCPADVKQAAIDIRSAVVDFQNY